MGEILFGRPLFGESNSSTRKKEDNDDEEEEEEEEQEEDEDQANKSKPSLFETAAVYEAKRASTHPAANIQGDTSTGEEHEVTKFQVCNFPLRTICLNGHFLDGRKIVHV